jgi:hypothetical protein
LGHHSQGLRKGSSSSGRLGWPLRSLSQLSPEGLSPPHGLGSVTPGLVPLADDLAKLQPPLLHLLGLGGHLLLGRRSLFSSRLRLCPRRHRCLRLQLITERPKVLELSKRSLEWQGRPSRGTPTPAGYGYLTRHLPSKATHSQLSGLASLQASPSARNEEETRYYTQVPRCSGLDSHNEQTPALKVPLQTELRFHPRGYDLPPHQRACETTNSRWLAANHYTSSDNDLRLGRQDNSSDGPRANVTAGRPSFTSPRGGREPAIKAKEPEARSAGGTDGVVGGETFSGCHHLSTDDSGHLPTNTAPASGGRPKAHWQVLTPVLATRTRTGPSQNTSTALTAYDVLCDPPVQPATVTRTEDGMLHPGQAAAVRLPPHGWRTPPP